MSWLEDAIWRVVIVFAALDLGLIIERYGNSGRHRQGKP